MWRWTRFISSLTSPEGPSIIFVLAFQALVATSAMLLTNFSGTAQRIEVPPSRCDESIDLICFVRASITLFSSGHCGDGILKSSGIWAPLLVRTRRTDNHLMLTVSLV